MKKLIEDMKNYTDLNPWYWRSIGEKEYAFDVVKAFPLRECDAIPKPGSQLYIDEDKDGNIIWVGENGTPMLIDGYIAESESQNGCVVCRFIAGCHAHFLKYEMVK